MGSFSYRTKTYEVDSQGFLLDISSWDEGFAEGLAPEVGIIEGLTDRHWKIIRFIRETYGELGRCPLVYQTCKMNGLHLRDLKYLFPAGYLRGACRLAGITYKEGFVSNEWANVSDDSRAMSGSTKTYRVDIRGFLVDWEEWDEQFAVSKAWEMKMPGPLSNRHFDILHYIRNHYRTHGLVPTVFDTCEANDIGLEELERLFPDGYHRGAVKLAGLRVR